MCWGASVRCAAVHSYATPSCARRPGWPPSDRLPALLPPLPRPRPADYLTVCLKWLESGGKADLPELLERYTVPDFNLTALTINGLEAPDFGAAEEEEGGAAAGGSVADEAAAGKDAAGEGAAAGGSAAGKAATAGANANAAGEEPAAGESGEAAEAAAPLEVRLGEEKEEPLAAQTSSAGRRRLLRRLF